MNPDRGALDGIKPRAAPYDGAIAARLARTDPDHRMKNWQHVLWADLGLAIGFALFMFVFFDDAVSKVFGGAAGVVMGLIAGILTFLGGARIAFRIAHELRNLQPTPAPNPQKADLADALRSRGSRSPTWEREPLLTDVIAVFVGLFNIAVGYTQQFNAIQYLPGDVRGTPEYHSAVFTIFAIIGLFCIVVGSIRLAQGLRRHRP
jgi:uncharacterized membrane protein HdeD (DUF308 family)